MSEITLESVEELAREIIAQDNAARERLVRLIAAEARIVARRNPVKFQRRATVYADKAGHWDNSYPPKQDYSARSGPRLLGLISRETEDVPTESGFYYDYRTITAFGGLFVDADGNLWTSDMSGTGTFGQFAAHPGECNVQCEIEWNRADVEEFATTQLQEAEARIRKLAFPLASERLAC
jgi:hypothetical protein